MRRNSPLRSYLNRVVALSLLAWVVAAVFVSGHAAAHPTGTSLLYLDVTESTLSGRIEVPYVDLATIFSLELGDSAESIRAALRSELRELHDYLDIHTFIGIDGQEWALTFGEVRLLSDRSDEEGFAVFPFEVELNSRSVPRQFTVTFDPLLDELDDRESIVLVGNDWLGGVVDAESNRLVVLTPDMRTSDIDLGKTSQWKNFASSTGVGVDHMRTGADHVFFILVLLLPSVLVFTDRWQPSANFGRSLWKVLKIAGMFTIAHSITFTLAGLDLVPLPRARIVESTIALSIAVAALHNLRPVLRNREWSVAVVFGLFHGLGFASLIVSLEIGRTTQLVSLIGRNVGIELGQALLIVLVFPTLYLLRDTRYYRAIFVCGSLVLATIALAWSVERIFEVSLGTNRLTARLIKWPQGLWILLAAAMASVLLRRIERRAGRLITPAR